MKRKDFFGAVVGGIAAIALGRKVADAAPVELPITNEGGSVPNTNPATILPAGGSEEVLVANGDGTTGWTIVPTEDDIRTYANDLALRMYYTHPVHSSSTKYVSFNFIGGKTISTNCPYIGDSNITIVNTGVVDRTVQILGRTTE